MKNFYARKSIDLVIELLAVIVGIFIALQIDSNITENEHRKTEIEYLYGFIKNLESDQKQLEELTAYYEQRYKANTQMLKQLDEPEEAFNFEIFDSLHSKYMYPLTFFPTPGAYHSIISSGELGLIGNKNIRIGLSELYERIYKRIDYNSKLMDDISYDYLKDLSEFYSFRNQQFKMNEFSKQFMQRTLDRQNIYNRFYAGRLKEAHKQASSLIVEVQSELDNLEN